MDDVRRCEMRTVYPYAVANLVLLGLSAAVGVNTAAGQNLESVRLHDPSSIVELNGRYYLFHTGAGVSAKSSTDLLDWDNDPRVFSTRPAWTTMIPANNGSFWAPDIAYFNNRYHLYYSVSSFGSQTSAIGLATNPTLDRSAPDFAWTDHGPIIQSQGGSTYNAIDPSIIQTSSGDVWMTFGSFWNGINLVPIDPATGMLPPRYISRNLARNAQIEASYIYEHEGEFFLFVNWGSCCQGSTSTYNIRVGRSSVVTGPYLDQRGFNMVDGGGTLFLETEGDFIGPGHISVFSEHGSEWFSYHYYDGDDFGRSKLNIRQLRWTEAGWPVAGPPFPIPEPATILCCVFAAIGSQCIRPRITSRRRTTPGRN
jgi:arabinan endo-1,5-alpha-L-arabinosidase